MAERRADDRIDGLRHVVEKQGDRMDSSLRDVRSDVRDVRKEMLDVRKEMRDARKDMHDLRKDMHDLRKDMDTRFDQLGVRLEARFDTMLYALIGLSGAMFAGMASLVAALIVTQL